MSACQRGSGATTLKRPMRLIVRCVGPETACSRWFENSVLIRQHADTNKTSSTITLHPHVHGLRQADSKAGKVSPRTTAHGNSTLAQQSWDPLNDTECIP